MIAGIDFSTKAVDIVLLHEDTDAATWHRFPLEGNGAFDRARAVGLAIPGRAMSFWDDIVAVGIEQPRGNWGVVHMARIQGAILSCIPAHKLVHPLNPSEWRKIVGLKGNATKGEVSQFVVKHKLGVFALSERGAAGSADPVATGPRSESADIPLGALPMPHGITWPQDACDAYCIALATRSLIQHTVAA